MIKLAKVINEKEKSCIVALGTDIKYYKSIGMTEMDVEQCSWNNGWYLKGYVPSKPQKLIIEERIKDFKNRLEELDEQSARPLRAILSGVGTDEDKQKLLDIETEAQALRQRIKDLQNDINL